MYRSSKTPGEINRDLTSAGNQKCDKDTIVFDGTDCFSETIDWLVTFKKEHRKVGKKIVEYEIQLIAHNGSAFDTYVVLFSWSNCHKNVNIVKNGRGRTSLEILKRNF